MVLERTKNEILVRLPANIDLKELQNMIDYLEYQELTMDSNVCQQDVDELSNKSNKSIWAKVKTKRTM